MIVVVCPVLARPHNAAPLAASLAANTTLPHRLVWVVSGHDEPQFNACKAAGGDIHLGDFFPQPGDFARKMNLAADGTDEPWLFQAADDVRFEPGWDTALMECAEQTGALVIGTQDGGNPTVKAGKHSTHTLIARSYIEDPGASMDGPGSVFSEAYGHQWCDTELVELAKSRGVWAFCHDSRVTHLHPFWKGRDLLDDTYRRGLASSREDARTYMRRSKLWTARRAKV